MQTILVSSAKRAYNARGTSNGGQSGHAGTWNDIFGTIFAFCKKGMNPFQFLVHWTMTNLFTGMLSGRLRTHLIHKCRRVYYVFFWGGHFWTFDLLEYLGALTPPGPKAGAPCSAAGGVLALPPGLVAHTTCVSCLRTQLLL